MDFSAVGLFMALALRETSRIPIGLIQTAVGGTPAKAWCSEETIQSMGIYVDELEQCRKSGYVSGVEAAEKRREQEWLGRARESFEFISDTPLSQKKTFQINIPGWWEDEFRDFCGTVCLEKRFFVTAKQSQADAEVLLGTLVDADRVLINGISCGSSVDKYTPRIYKQDTDRE